MQMLPNISGSKENQTIKFGQLIEYSCRNNFRQKSYRKMRSRPLSVFKKVLYWVKASGL